MGPSESAGLARGADALPTPSLLLTSTGPAGKVAGRDGARFDSWARRQCIYVLAALSASLFLEIDCRILNRDPSRPLKSSVRRLDQSKIETSSR